MTAKGSLLRDPSDSGLRTSIARRRAKADVAPTRQHRRGDQFAQIDLRVRANHRFDGIVRDDWRECWTVYCRAPPVAGRANRAVLGLVAGWLGVPLERVCWEHSGRASRKRLTVEGLSEEECRARLGSAALASAPGRRTG